MEAIVFNIQKFSLHDGPGIRTVVFLKGCPLRCGWCSNPESQAPGAQVLWDAGKCARCGVCVGACPGGAITLADGAVRADGSRCLGCGACAGACPNGALTLEGVRRALGEVLGVCLQDRDFYEESGGGVTLSGGEPMAQPDFAAALLDALRAEGIHTAIETTGFAPPEVFERVSAKTDLLLLDMKHWDARRHLEGTGVSNAPILANTRRAMERGIEVLPRIPVIPGYNDSLEDARGFCARLKEVGAARAQLLPFHQFGERKYEQLGLAYAYRDAAALRERDLTSYRDQFLCNGIDAFF